MEGGHGRPLAFDGQRPALRGAQLVAEARAGGMLGGTEAATLTGVPNVRQRGHWMGNWLNREQARELLQVPDRSTLKGKRDYCILALLAGCALPAGARDTARRHTPAARGPLDSGRTGG